MAACWGSRTWTRTCVYPRAWHATAAAFRSTNLVASSAASILTCVCKRSGVVGGVRAGECCGRGTLRGAGRPSIMVTAAVTEHVPVPTGFASFTQYNFHTPRALLLTSCLRSFGGIGGVWGAGRPLAEPKRELSAGGRTAPVTLLCVAARPSTAPQPAWARPTLARAQQHHTIAPHLPWQAARGLYNAGERATRNRHPGRAAPADFFE